MPLRSSMTRPVIRPSARWSSRWWLSDTNALPAVKAVITSMTAIASTDSLQL